jgi:tetratricopeptide (TPR) repeat protein
MSKATVVVKGKLTQHQDVNYLLMTSFKFAPPPREPAQPKPKGEAPGKAKAMTSPVDELVKEGVAARYDHKDISAAEKAWRQALPLLDRPGVTPLDRYQVYAGLGLIHGERKEYAEARELFQKAVAASREISDNRKPLSYSHYNLACAEALLGDKESALASLRAALEAERQTDRRRYVKLAGGDDSFAALKDDEHFLALLKEFAEPTKAGP